MQGVLMKRQQLIEALEKKGYTRRPDSLNKVVYRKVVRGTNHQLLVTYRIGCLMFEVIMSPVKSPHEISKHTGFIHTISDDLIVDDRYVL